MGLFGGGGSNSSTEINTDSSTHDLRTVGDNGALVVGQGATFNGLDPATMKALGEYQSDGIKTMASFGTDTLNKLGDSVTNVLDKSGANMATAWSHQVDVMGQSLEGLTAASKANADAGQVVATAALKANANAGATISDVAKWAAVAVGLIVGLKFFSKAKA